MRLSVDERFWAKVSQAEALECWEWTAYKIPTGYGLFYPKHGEGWLAHRWAYQSLIADIPDGLVLDHLCSNRGCVNPWHLEPVTQKINIQRGEQATRTHCPKGHEYTPENTHRGAKGWRWCKACWKDRNAARYAAKKAARAHAEGTSEALASLELG